jgi:hypothetical protein
MKNIAFQKTATLAWMKARSSSLFSVRGGVLGGGIEWICRAANRGAAAPSSYSGRGGRVRV